MENTSPREIFARRVREARKRRGWKQQQLADRLAELGYPGLSRATIAKIEDPTSTRSNASLEDVLAIAAALDCAPVHLIAPLEDDDVVQVTPGLPPAKAAMVRDWIRGSSGPLRFALNVVDRNLDDLAAFMSQQPPTWIRRAAAAQGLDQDQIEDTVHALQEAGERRTENIAWPSGGPTVERDQIIRVIDQMRTVADAAEETLKRFDEQQEREEQ
jgi:transcriptional regulator with XRE-family HTH domain